MPERTLYGELHTHRCETCERLYTCGVRHTGAHKPSYRCEDCQKAKESEPPLPAKLPHAAFGRFQLHRSEGRYSSRRHEMMPAERRYRCSICGKPVVDVGGLRRHATRMHDGAVAELEDL
ncbi:MAG: hypothetical protein PHC88_05475 [Terrimicrobiaceae bacterium]|nr:hypothetical protein [Terrimicrobiaceae bacterium]